MPEYKDQIDAILDAHDADDRVVAARVEALERANSDQTGVISDLLARIAAFEPKVLLDKPGTVRVKLPANKFGGSQGRNTVTELKEPADQINVTYELLFEKGFEIHRGLKLPGPTGVQKGVNPLQATDGRPGLGKAVSGRLMLLDELAGSWFLPPEMKVRRRANKGGEVVVYAYSNGQREKFGDNIWTNFAPPFGEWVKFDLGYRMNTVGAKDGGVSVNINEGHQLDINNFDWRSSDLTHWTHLVESIFPGGADMNYTAPFDRFIQIRNIKVTTPAA